jgi:ABC-type phosphate/phosphonate transport system ATPase subunit
MSAGRGRLPGRLDAMMQRFPMLKDKANAQASTLSGGQQKMLEVALEQGQTRIEDSAPKILADPQIAQLFLGGGMAPAERVP